MAPLKSQTQVDIYLGTLTSMLRDFAAMYPLQLKSFLRDELTLKSRVASEGLSFLTKTLPKLGKAIDLALETGKLIVPREFKRSQKNRSIPAFLQGMISFLFGAGGDLVPEPNFRVLQCIRQFCFLCYKLELPYDDGLQEKFLNNFIAVDESLDLPSHSAVLSTARRLVTIVCQDFDSLDIQPKHGPGAVATGEKGDDKWNFSRFIPSLHSRFPWHEYFSCPGQWREPGTVKFFDEYMRDACARVVLVPKDSRGPRVISCEPLELQWIQQGIARNLIKSIENCSLTRGKINFKDQSVNGELARISSRYGYFATLDLQEASDRVSCDLVKMMFPEEHHASLFAARSTSTQLPDGRIVQLKKYAPMGSALCFPVESLIFWALCVAAVAESRHCGLLRAAGDVYVYGDDIIVAIKDVDAVVQTLESCSLKVNVTKSYRYGSFRESCGIDAFNGFDVTPTKIRTLWSGSMADGNAFASYTAYANDFWRKGFRETAQYIRNHIESVYGLIPYGGPNCGYPCIEHPSRLWAALLNKERGFKLRWNALRCRTEIRVKTLIPMRLDTTLNEYPRLLRALTGNTGTDPDVITVPRRYKLRSRWMRAT